MAGDSGSAAGSDAAIAGHGGAGSSAGSGAGGESGAAGTAGSTGGVGGDPTIGGQGGGSQAGSDADPIAGQGGREPEPQGGQGGSDSQAGQGGAPEPEGGQGGSMPPVMLLPPELTDFSIVNEQGFATIASGETLLGSVTFHNPNDQPFTIRQIVIAGRAPGGTHAGGPYFDLSPIRNRPTIIAPGESITYSASRTMRVTDPLGVWEFYPTWQEPADSEWHDGESSMIEVVRLPRDDDQDSGM